METTFEAISFLCFANLLLCFYWRGQETCITFSVHSQIELISSLSQFPNNFRRTYVHKLIETCSDVCTSSLCIDNIIGEHSIVSLFANKYEQVNNSVRYDEHSFSFIIIEKNIILHRCV